MLMRSASSVGLLVGLLVLAGTSHGQNWPSFRGEDGSGVGSGEPAISWNVEDGAKIKWKTRIPGLAHSSPIVWGDRVFVTTAVSSASDPPDAKTGWLNGTGDSAPDSGAWTWKVLCLDRDTGKIVWERDAHTGVPKSKRHMKASHANCTPATDGKHVVAFLGSEGLYCFQVDGTLKWKKDLGVFEAGPHDAPDLQWGMAGSPIIHGDKVIVQCDAMNTSFWASFDIETGAELRRVQREEKTTTWSTPTVVETGGGTQLVCNGWKQVAGYDLESGEKLWWLHDGGDCPVPRPLFGHGLIFITNGHGRSPIYAIKPEARGDITPSEDSASLPAGLAWWQPKGGSYMPTPIVLADYLYVASDNGIISAFDPRSGEQKYKERLQDAGTFSASVVSAGRRLYFVNEDGVVFVIKSGEKFELLARNSMGEVCMATPAISDGMLLIRGRDHLYGIAPRLTEMKTRSTITP